MEKQGIALPSKPHSAVGLFLLGFLTLFLELALIRYLAGNIYNLGYFPNLVLLGVFVGMGIGFVFHHHLSEFYSRCFFEAAFFLLFLLILFVFVDAPVVPGFSQWVGNVGGEVFFTAAKKAGEHDLRVIVFLFLGLVSLFSLISQRTAKYFQAFAPLTSYSLDIAGSCCGILCFMLMSWLNLPAYIWFLLLIPIVLFLQEEDPPVLRLLLCLPLPLIVVFAWQQDSQSWNRAAKSSGSIVRWSPYQKIGFAPNKQLPAVYVNGIGHQEIYSSAKLPKSIYYYPYIFRSRHSELPPLKSVLIIGAGTGNDVAAALQNGAAHVDAVEIDPVIAALGKKYHPAHPYQDPRVRLIIDDGRAFLARTHTRYDLIIFALTDSLVKVSPMSQLRLENYLFTRESVRRAVNQLDETGFLIFYNFYRLPFVADKIQIMVHAATGRYPFRTYHENDFSMMVIGRNFGAAATPPLGANLQGPTDDWPFLYLKEKAIPGLYWKAMCGLALFILVLALSVQYSNRWTSDRERSSGYAKLAFVFMGISFLLLETKSVIQFSLLFGTTWINTSLVFLAVLISVLLANWTARLLARPKIISIAYICLIFFCLYSLLFPLSDLLAISNRLFRFLLASILTFSPIFFANLIFGLAFREREHPEELFGWNLIGAALGGIIEYTSMAVGYNALALLVALCYTLAFFFLKREQVRRMKFVPA